MKKVLHLDLETRSDVDLRACGLFVYVESPHTDILVACYAFDDGPIETWFPGQPVPKEIIAHVELGYEVHAHNAAFEQALINSVGVRKYGWPRMETNQMVCTAAMAFAMGLPARLGTCAESLNTPERKSEDGYRLMLQLSSPRQINSDKTVTWWNPNEDGKLERLTEYCKQDVIVERAIEKRMLRLSPFETKVWEFDQLVNGRGVCIDIGAAYTAMDIVSEEKLRLNREIRAITHDQISSCQAVSQIKDYLKFRRIELPEALAKKDVIDLLERTDLPPDVRSVLELRKEAGKASTAKLNSMVKGASNGNRLKGMFQYSGANTRRWSGRRVQLQNLKRPTIKQKQIEWVLDGLSHGLSRDQIAKHVGPPMDVISNCIRGFIIAEDGNELLVSDWSAIEARVISWLADEQDVLDIFEKGEDVYVHAAAAIFGIPPERVNPEQRQVGKVAILALGYGGGVGAFQTMAKAYGVSMAEAFDSLWSRVHPDKRDFLEKRFSENKDNYIEISRKEYLASDATKVFWREANPKIVRYWRELEDAAMDAVRHPNEEFKAGPQGREVTYKTRGSFLWCKLPSNGVICYPYPQIKEVSTPWKTKKLGLTYMAEDAQTKTWKRFTTYGGSLAENITQSVARDILADSMLRLEDAGFPVVAHIHDEVICEAPIGTKSLHEMERIMGVTPQWARGLPLVAKGWNGKRFRK